MAPRNSTSHKANFEILMSRLNPVNDPMAYVNDNEKHCAAQNHVIPDIRVLYIGL